VRPSSVAATSERLLLSFQKPPERGCVGPPTSRSKLRTPCFTRILEAFPLSIAVFQNVQFGENTLKMRTDA
jgi:hypothetical protein